MVAPPATATAEPTALDTAIAYAAAHADDYSLTAWAWSLPRPVVVVVDRELVIVDGIPYVTEVYYDHVDGAWGVVDQTAAAPALLDAQDTGAGAPRRPGHRRPRQRRARGRPLGSAVAGVGRWRYLLTRAEKVSTT